MKRASDKVSKIVERLLDECGDKIPADCLMSFAEKNNIVITKVNRPDLSATKGGIRKIDGKYEIRINTYRGKDKTDNLTLAHELGHYYLGHLEKENSPEEEKQNEREAFEFAYELLMSQTMFNLFFGANPFDFYTLTSISEYFKVSKFVAASRYVQLSDESLAVIAVENQKLRQFERSESFSYRIKHTGTNVSANQILSKIHKSKKIQSSYSEVPSTDWLEEPLPQGRTLHELTHSKGGQTALTLLKVQ